MRTGKVLFVMVAVLAMAGIGMAQDVPVANGDFEDVAAPSTSPGWAIFPSGTNDLGWTVAWYGGSTSFGGQNRPGTANLEIHNNVKSGWNRVPGSQYAELDTDWDGPNGGLNNEPASVYIYQDIDTCYGAEYELTFWYSPRPDKPANTSSLGLYVDDTQIGTTYTETTHGWKSDTVSFMATGAKTKIGFKEEGNPDSFGMFLDDVTVEQVSSCQTTVTLCEAQYDPIGGVTVYEEDGFLYVTFAIDSLAYPNRFLDEVHVAVVTDPGDFPTVGKPNPYGNPVPGQFPYSCDPYDPITPMDTMCTAQIDLAEIGGCGPLYVAAHASVIQVDGDGCQTEDSTFWASNVIASDQGTNKDDSDIKIDRTTPDAVTGEPDWEGGESGGTFFSLGFKVGSEFGGSVEVVFGDPYAPSPVYNGEGADICVQEATNHPSNSSYPEETAQVFGIVETVGYPFGEVKNTKANDEFECVDMSSSPVPLAMVDSVKILDVTDPSIHINSADAYDVDAIGACYLYRGDETAWGAACEPADGTRFTERGNWGTFFTYEGLPACE